MVWVGKNLLPTAAEVGCLPPARLRIFAVLRPSALIGFNKSLQVFDPLQFRHLIGSSINKAKLQTQYTHAFAIGDGVGQMGSEPGAECFQEPGLAQADTLFVDNQLEALAAISLFQTDKITRIDGLQERPHILDLTG